MPLEFSLIRVALPFKPWCNKADAGAKITLASPAGGKPPLDPKSDAPDAQTAATRRFEADPVSIKLIETALSAQKPVAAVCHAPGVLRHVEDLNGKSIVAGKAVTGFSNSEEDAVGLTEVVPFLVEDMLKTNAGRYSKAADWQVYVEVDGLLITGQNPASSAATAQALLSQLN